MTKSEIQNYINGIISKGYEPEVYAFDDPQKIAGRYT